MRIPRNYLRDELAVEAFAGQGARGVVYEASRVVRASVQPTTRLTTDTTGREIAGVLAVVVRPEEAIPVESRVTWQGQRYRVAQSDPMPDNFRPTHRELILSRLG
jgi:hypothetical protein